MAIRPIDRVRAAFPGAKRQASGWYAACCPVHEDEHESFGFRETEDGKVHIRCQAGCDWRAILGAVGLRPQDLYPDGGNGPTRSGNGAPARPVPASRPTPAAAKQKARGRLVEVYDYRRLDGSVAHQTLRWEPKGFSQRQPAVPGTDYSQRKLSQDGAWVNDLVDCETVLYRLPELVQAIAREEVVFLVEGEKDANNLARLGLAATCNAMGAEKWEKRYTSALAGADVVIIPDNDPAGEKHLRLVADALQGAAKRVRVLYPPGVGQHGDISDWLAAGGTMEKLLELVAAAERAPVEIETRGRAPIALVRDAVRVLLDANEPPHLFMRGGYIHRLRQDELGRTFIHPSNADHLRGLLMRQARFVVSGKNGKKDLVPPKEVVNDILEMGEIRLPQLERVTETPVLRPDGSILLEPGYDPDTRFYYAPPPGLHVPPIPEEPTREDVEAALALIGEAIGEFPYDGPASMANAYGLLLTPLVLPAVTGMAMMALIDAPSPGTGKGLLAQAITHIATGSSSAMLGAPTTEEEWQKTIGSVLSKGRLVNVIDNVDRPIGSPALAMALTSPVYEVRLLGTNRTLCASGRVTWIATGNNIQLTGGSDLPRRCYRVRLDAKVSEPWRLPVERFRHPGDTLLTWVAANRGRLLSALLTLCQVWLNAGRPRGPVQHTDTFAGWLSAVGGILETVGIEGFASDLSSVYAETDDETSQWEAWLREWPAIYGERYVTVAEIIADLTEAREGLQRGTLFRPELAQWYWAMPAGLMSKMDAKRGFAQALGLALTKRREVRHGNDGVRLVMETDSHRKQRQFSVRSDADASPETGMDGEAGWDDGP
jgi:hypothetical protein